MEGLRRDSARVRACSEGKKKRRRVCNGKVGQEKRGDDSKHPNPNQLCFNRQAASEQRNEKFPIGTSNTLLLCQPALTEPARALQRGNPSQRNRGREAAQRDIDLIQAASGLESSQWRGFEIHLAFSPPSFANIAETGHPLF